MDIEIEQQDGHYVVYTDGVFFCTADTHKEAAEELMNEGLVS